MSALGRFVTRHRLLVALAWLAILAASLAGAGHVSGRLSQQFSLPGQPGYEANQRILRAYHNGGQSAPLVPVITLPAGATVDSPGVRAELARSFAAVARNDPAVRVVSYASAGDRGFVARDDRTTFGLVFTPGTGRLDDNQSARAAAIAAALRAAVPGSSVRVTGLPALTSGGSSSDPGVVAETLLGALGALAVLAVVFGSLLALVPLLVAAVAILTTFLLVLGLTTVTDVSFLAQYLIALIGLGVAIDYSLLLVTRWREERARGHGNRDAVVLAMGTAGRAISFSAVTVDGTIAAGAAARRTAAVSAAGPIHDQFGVRHAVTGRTVLLAVSEVTSLEGSGSIWPRCGRRPTGWAPGCSSISPIRPGAAATAFATVVMPVLPAGAWPATSAAGGPGTAWRPRPSRPITPACRTPHARPGRRGELRRGNVMNPQVQRVLAL